MLSSMYKKVDLGLVGAGNWTMCLMVVFFWEGEGE